MKLQMVRFYELMIELMEHTEKVEDLQAELYRYFPEQAKQAGVSKPK